MYCIFRKSDGKPMGGTRHLPCHADVDRWDEDRNLIPGTQIVVELNRDTYPDPETERWDAGLQVVRLKNATELEQHQLENYAKLRRDEYPGTGDQFDMLWHGMDQNVLPRVEPFYTVIKNLKLKYPKPS